MGSLSRKEDDIIHHCSCCDSRKSFVLKFTLVLSRINIKKTKDVISSPQRRSQEISRFLQWRDRSLSMMLIYSKVVRVRSWKRSRAAIHNRIQFAILPSNLQTTLLNKSKNLMKNLLLSPLSETIQKNIKDRDSNKSWSTYQTYQLGKVWCPGLKPNRNSFLAIRKLRSLSQTPILSHSSKASDNPSSNQYSLVHCPHLTAHLSSLSNHQMQRRSFWWQILNNHCLSWSSKT